ncbi:hypothetical protein GO495_02225 [Chitinophaga oryziterrae]|uniref:Uncharacterized protein n=1 Tax=Chitinophaga oryziterrae TaxID=1031224 RepID=A0A6N8J2G2_9BACT|nr:hypothetical protein [Chitinophaga oryziterrae]MVT39390.1 hypothetical protein [Chitinophaga oryziterrae]
MAKATRIKKIDLEKSLMLRIQGEAGKYNTLPWDMLKKVGDSLQELIRSIAKNEINNDQAIDLANFDIELADFFKGSAVPNFKLTPRVKPTVSDVYAQREVVSRRFSVLMNIAGSGSYLELKKQYTSIVVRNDIAEKVYDFVSSFGNSPVEIVNKKGKGFSSLYSIKKFNPKIKEELISKVVELELPNSADELLNGVATVKVKKNKKGKLVPKISEYYISKEASLSFAPDIINVPGRQYILDFPLRSSLSKEDGHFIIECEMLDIVATGQTEEEAENIFNQEFDYIYTRYNSLPENQLSVRLLKVKKFINLLVKQVIEV